MSATKNLTTAAAAIALAGAIGFTYAQSTNDPAQPASTDSTQMQTPAADTTTTPPAASDSSTTPATPPTSDAATPTTTDNSVAPEERAPKADRG